MADDRVGLSVYIHLPYCSLKCPYCDFNVHIVKTIPETAYVAALKREIGFASSETAWSGRSIATVFFGGGTPSMFAPESIASVLGVLSDRFGLDPDCEVNLEANPDELAATVDFAGDLRSAGVTRLSVGVQSFDADVLATLGRSHGPQTIDTALDAVFGAGFASVSYDLIFAVPGQSRAGWSADLERATAAGFDHVSTYNLTYEQGTPLTGLRDAGRITQVADSIERELYECALEHFARKGFEQYEVSSFARPSHRCRHNQAYWQWNDFLGVGAGAHGFTRSDGDGFGRRYENLRQPAAYMSADDGHWAAWQESLDLAAAVKELMLTGLRKIDGVGIATLRDVLGEDALTHYPRLGQLEAAGLIAGDGESIRLTHDGLLVADSVIESLVID
jgi:oxygen-independent coproporphyrinogen-3 oxidase